MDERRREAEGRFRTIFEESSRPLLGYVLRRVREPADAADVVAETFVVAWRRLDDMPTGADARFWLFGVARNLLSNQQRGANRRSNLASRLRVQLGAQVTFDHSGPADTRHVVATAMARLGPDDRELLRLASWEGLSPAEIAVAFSIPPGTARTRLHRARARFRVQMEALGWHGRRDDPVRDGVAGPDVVDERLLVRDVEENR